MATPIVDVMLDVAALHEAKQHQPQLVLTKHVHPKLHGSGMVGRFNANAATLISGALSNMWFFWFCVVLDVISLPAVFSGQMTIGNYLSSVVIQLLALPVLSVQSARQQATSDSRAEEDHRTIKALLTINRSQLQLLETQGKELATIRKIWQAEEGDKRGTRNP